MTHEKVQKMNNIFEIGGKLKEWERILKA